jgi:hypothetical protein
VIEIATGTIDHSGIKFKLLVSEPVSADDLRALANQLHAAAIKIENELV